MWFYLPIDGSRERLLAGYDGKTWVDCKTEGPAQKIIGFCPDHDSAAWVYHTNAFQDGTAFFIAMGGVHCYNGKEWMFLDFKLKVLDSHYIGLAPLHDKKTLVAYIPVTPSPVYVWRGGQWTETPLPEALKKGECHGVAPADEGGVWLFWYDGGGTNDGVMDYWPLGAGLPPDFAAQAERLGSNDFKVRAAATEEMSKGDRRTMMLATKAAGEAKDPEVRSRLRDIASAISSRPAGRLRLGDYTVKGVWLRRVDTLGNAYIFVENAFDADGKEKGVALFVARPGHKPVPLWDEEYAQAWHQGFELCGPRPVGDGQRIWLPGTRFAHPARLIDTEDGGRTVLESPDSRFGILGSALADGTIFMSGGELVGVCRPGAKDDRHLLKADAHQVDQVDVGPDGTVWADLWEKGIHTFKGKEWEPVKGLDEFRWAHWLAAGRDGTALVRIRKAAFVNKGEVHVGEDLRTVIQQHTADAAVAFCSLSAAIYGGGEGGGVVADKAGHIWLLDDRHLGVLVKDQWLEPAAADGIDPAKIKHMALAGDASRVYLTYDEYDAKGRNSFFGEVKDGRLVFAPRRTPPSSTCHWASAIPPAACGSTRGYPRASMNRKASACSG